LDYYEAVAKVNQAQAAESEARYNALVNMSRGTGEASVAAVMAIALSERKQVAPQFIEDDALKWASILAGPVAAVTSLAIQADLSRDLNKSNQKIAIARIDADAATDQALYSALTKDAPTPTPYLGVDGLGVVVDGLVTLGTAGLSGVGDMGALGMESTLTATSIGYQTIEEISKHDNVTLENIVEHLKTTCLICQMPPVDPPVVTVTGGVCDGIDFSPSVCVP
jgi:hypothetical protein